MQPATAVVVFPRIDFSGVFVLLSSVSRTPAAFGHARVCLFDRLLGRGHPRLLESADGGRLRGEVMEEEALIGGLSPSDPLTQIACVDSVLRPRNRRRYFNTKQASRKTQASVNI